MGINTGKELAKNPIADFMQITGNAYLLDSAILLLERTNLTVNKLKEKLMLSLTKLHEIKQEERKKADKISETFFKNTIIYDLVVPSLN